MATATFDLTLASIPRLDGYLHLFATELVAGDVLVDRSNPARFNVTVTSARAIESGRTIRVNTTDVNGKHWDSYYGPGDLFAVVRPAARTPLCNACETDDGRIPARPATVHTAVGKLCASCATDYRNATDAARPYSDGTYGDVGGTDDVC